VASRTQTWHKWHLLPLAVPNFEYFSTNMDMPRGVRAIVWRRVR